ncbi:MAG TPA: FecR family protein [Chthoniobacterales bacterium]|nr:FecR family protein [Chthoniobacterales bacterium]
MNDSPRILTGILLAALLLAAGAVAVSETADKEARVTRIIKDVKILPSESDARPAVIDDKVQEGTAVRTGDESRSELTFVDLTITRLGANTVYSFDKAGRNIRLQSGTILVRVPKDSGGAEITTSAVTVAITGTTGIFALTPEGQNSLIILEGDARMSLNKYPGKSARVRAGKRIDVEADAKKLSQPTDVDLEELMKTSPLITDFPPLPSQDLILEAIRKQNPRSHVTSLPSGGGPTQSGPVVYPNQPVITGGPPPPPPFWWCCIDGRVVQSTEAECRARGGQLYRSEQEARRHCGDRRQCWCCAHGEVFRTTEVECQRGGGQCFGSEQEARQHCKPTTTTTTCWCCVEGQVAQTTEAECRSREGQCYGSRKEASRHCRGERATPNEPYPTPTPKRPKHPPKYPPGNVTNPDEPYPTPTPHKKHPKDNNPQGSGYGGSGQFTNPYTPQPTPTPRKSGSKRQPKYPGGQPTPTPIPQKIY